MNIRLKSLFSVGLLGLLCLMLPKAARADDFTFSFTGPLGTVTGEIFGLTNSTTGPIITAPATGVTITSFPARFLGGPGLVNPETDLFSPSWFILNNLFTERLGVITGPGNGFDAISRRLGLLTTFQLNTLANSGRLIVSDIRTGAILSASSGPIVFSPVATVPEPSSFSLMLIGLMALGTLVAVSTQKTGSALESRMHRTW